MKKVFWFALSFISLLSLQSLALDNPYASGGSQYGGDDFYLDNTPSNSPYSNNSSSSYCTPNNTNSSYANTNTYSSPNTYSNSNTNNNLNSSSNFNSNNTGSTIDANSSAAPEAQAPQSPWSKVENWFQRKSLNKNTEKPELDLANQRIQAGKARIRAIKAKEKLDSHLAECQAKTQALTEELNKAEEQAALIENQVKFQEGNKI